MDSRDALALRRLAQMAELLMPFLQAGFNFRHRNLGIMGWTRSLEGNTGFSPAVLIRLVPSGDLAWLHNAERPRFVAWGETLVLGTRPEFELPDEWQHDLPQSPMIQPKSKIPVKVSLVIYGEPASKANSRELVTMNRWSPKKNRMVKMPASIKSDKARDYERNALLQIPPKARVRLEGPVRVTLHIFYETERPDLDESIVLDVMQDRYVRHGEGEDAERVLVQKGVYRNDRQVREKHVYWGKDPANPRSEIEVELLEPETQRDLLQEAIA